MNGLKGGNIYMQCSINQSKKKENSDVCDNIDEYGEHFSKWYNPVMKRNKCASLFYICKEAIILKYTKIT